MRSYVHQNSSKDIYECHVYSMFLFLGIIISSSQINKFQLKNNLEQLPIVTFNPLFCFFIFQRKVKDQICIFGLKLHFGYKSSLTMKNKK